MNRRDLLLFRTRAGKRVYELGCERLYMRFLDARRPDAAAAPLDDHWLGEPEPQYHLPGTQELFDALRRDLAGADVLRVVDPHWLADAELRQAVDGLVAAFRAAGGHVEFVGDPPADLPAASPPGAPARA